MALQPINDVHAVSMQQFADVRGPHTASFVTLTALLERKFLKVPIYRLQIFGVITAERAAMANTCSKNTCLGQLKSFWKSSRGVARSLLEASATALGNLLERSWMPPRPE